MSSLPIDAHCGTSTSDPFCWDSAWAIAGYCFAASFVFGVSQIISRHLMTNKASTQVMMHGINSAKTYSVKRGRTRLVAELLTLSFLFRGVWFGLKGMPGNQWACYTTQKFPNATRYGDWEYALREMFGRFATLMSFSGFTIIVIFWAGTSTIPSKHKVHNTETTRLDAYSQDAPKTTKPKYTCCQGFYVSLNVWLYVILIGVTMANFIPNELNDKCVPTKGFVAKQNYTCWCVGGMTNTSAFNGTVTRANACLENRTHLSFFGYNETYTWRDVTPWHTIYEVQVLFTNCLYVLLVIGLTVFGARLMRTLKTVHTDGDKLANGSDAAVHERESKRNDNSSSSNFSNRRTKRRSRRACGIEAMRCKILAIIISCTVCFLARFTLFIWPYVTDVLFTGLACNVIRPYFQYVVVELVPALLVLIVMHPVANRPAKPKFSTLGEALVPNDAEALVVRGGSRATTYGVGLLAANDPKHHF